MLPYIQAVLPRGKRLIEPFAGSAAVSLGIDYPRYLVADANVPLIGLYQQLKTEGEPFIQYCRTFFKETNNCADVYYRFRSRFNNTDDPRLKAALFVWLNRHTYNGLYRVNAKGHFNSPFGRYVRPYFPEREMLAFVLRSRHMVFRALDYKVVLKAAKLGDVVYADPPYVPLSSTANFTDYATGGFTADDQTDLASEARRLAKQGVPVVISNHDTPGIRALYHGASLTCFEVRRTISQDIANRGKAGELLALFS